MNELANLLNVWLAKQLDIFKVKNPLLFFVIQGLILTTIGLIQKGSIEVSNPVVYQIVLTIAGFFIQSRTSSFIKK